MKYNPGGGMDLRGSLLKPTERRETALRRQGSIRKVVHSGGQSLAGKVLDRPLSLALSYSHFIQEYAIIAEFNMLADHPVPGVYAIPSAKSSLLWYGVIFVRSGPYRGAIFRFNLLIPESFPSSSCPRVVLEGEAWHPLVEPGSGELDLSHFRDWSKDAHHLYHLLAYIHDIFTLASHTMYNEDEDEFASKCEESAKWSVASLSGERATEDCHYISFREAEHSIGGPSKLDVSLSTPRPPPPLSWVAHGSLDTFSAPAHLI